VNDFDLLWNILQSCNEDRIDIIADNSGFELYMDLCLADWLIRTKYASTVYIHLKNMPWFVSDASKKDLYWLLSQCKEDKEGKMKKYVLLFDSILETLRSISNRWNKYIEEGMHTFRPFFAKFNWI
jgi:hypothetical protein